MIEVTTEPTVRVFHPNDPDVWAEVALPNSVEEALQTAALSKFTQIVALKDQEGGIVRDERGEPVTARLPVIPPEAIENMFAKRLRGWGGMTRNGEVLPFPDEVTRKKDPKWWHILGSPALGFFRDVEVKNTDGTPKLDPKTGEQVILRHQWTSFVDFIFDKSQANQPREKEAQGNG